MYTIFKALTLLLLVAQPVLALSKGDKCSDFSLKTPQNSTISLAQQNGKVVYLDFWASWCAPCKKSLPWLNHLKAKYAPQGLEIIAINLDVSSKDAEKLLGENTCNLKIAYDPQGLTPPLYEIDTMPSSFLIDRQGKLISTFKGFREEDENKIIEEIESALQNRN